MLVVLYETASYRVEWLVTIHIKIALYFFSRNHTSDNSQFDSLPTDVSIAQIVDIFYYI